MRDTSERPEAIMAGTAKLVGTLSSKIVEETSALLTNVNSYSSMVKKQNPYGDGTAAEKIVKIVVDKMLRASKIG